MLLWALVCFTAAAAGCGGAGATPANTLAVQQGKAIYDRQCAQCHDATTDLHLLKDPPRLNQLFAKSSLPSGAPATDEEVRDVILHGRGIMPPFELTLDKDDLDALIRYLHSR